MNMQKLILNSFDSLYGPTKKAIYQSGRELMPTVKNSVIEKYPFFNPTTPIKIEPKTNLQNIDFKF